MSHKTVNQENSRIKCGIIMPIASYGTYSEEFWTNVRSFLVESIQDAGLEPIPAWENDTNDVIHAKIIENIASFPVMVGVIIGFNPNVMIECGMRLWTNKPILFLHSAAEKIPFDVGSISCLSFPVDFNFFKCSELKKEIANRLKDLMGKQYKAFKSYYGLPKEVEEPKETKKIDFSQFVSEVRSNIQSLKDLLKTVLQRTESIQGASFIHQRFEVPGTRSGGVISYPTESIRVSPPSFSTPRSIAQTTSDEELRVTERFDVKEIK